MNTKTIYMERKHKTFCKTGIMTQMLQVVSSLPLVSHSAFTVAVTDPTHWLPQPRLTLDLWAGGYPFKSSSIHYMAWLGLQNWEHVISVILDKGIQSFRYTKLMNWNGFPYAALGST